MNAAAEDGRASSQIEPLFPGCSLVRVHGEVDWSSASVLDRTLDRALREGAAQLVVDCEPVRFMDSAGVHCLVRTWRRLGARSRRLVIVAPSSSAARRALFVSGWAQLIPVMNTVDEARQVLTSGTESA